MLLAEEDIISIIMGIRTSQKFVLEWILLLGALRQA